MSPEKLKVISDFLNTQENLPEEVQAIADELKASVNSEVAPVEESVPVVEE